MNNGPQERGDTTGVCEGEVLAAAGSNPGAKPEVLLEKQEPDIRKDEEGQTGGAGEVQGLCGQVPQKEHGLDSGTTEAVLPEEPQADSSPSRDPLAEAGEVPGGGFNATFLAQDVMFRSSTDGGYKVTFDLGGDLETAMNVAKLGLFRKTLLKVHVELGE